MAVVDHIEAGIRRKVAGRRKAVVHHNSHWHFHPGCTGRNLEEDNHPGSIVGSDRSRSLGCTADRMGQTY